MFKRPIHSFHPAVLAFLAAGFNARSNPSPSSEIGIGRLLSKVQFGPSDIGAVQRRYRKTGSRSKYTPHQGQRECDRRKRQLAKQSNEASA